MIRATDNVAFIGAMVKSGRFLIEDIPPDKTPRLGDGVEAGPPDEKTGLTRVEICTMGEGALAEALLEHGLSPKGNEADRRARLADHIFGGSSS